VGRAALAFFYVAMIIGVVADTHGLLRSQVISALRGSDRIIHAGDIGNLQILDKLGEIAPVTAVRGNVDRGTWAKKIPATGVLEVRGVSIYVLHVLQQLDLKPEVAGFAVVVSGHSHAPKQDTKNGVLYFNPGSAGPQRFGLPVTVGKLVVSGDQVNGEILNVIK
jgi:uncharacterized protein